MIDIRHSSPNVPVEEGLTVKTRNRCDDCQNSYICKYVEAYMKAVDELRSFDLPDTMKIEASCKHYKSSSEGTPKVSIRGRNIDKGPRGDKYDRDVLDDVQHEVDAYAD